MDFLITIIYGIVQGITEFLPISSSGHLIILHKWLPLRIIDDLVFDVVLHLATVLAVVWFFRRDIKELIIAWFKSFGGKINDNARLSWLILLATVPAGLAGLLFENAITSLRSTQIVIIMLVLVGFLFIVAEKYARKQKEFKNVNTKDAIFIGVAQVLSLIPGTSRSGITIIAGLMTGLKRQAALKFSFLMSVPIILGANLKKIPDLLKSGMNLDEGLLLMAAFMSAWFSGILVIKYFLKYARYRSLNIFAWYRFLLAAIIFVLLII